MSQDKNRKLAESMKLILVKVVPGSQLRFLGTHSSGFSHWFRGRNFSFSFNSRFRLYSDFRACADI